MWLEQRHVQLLIIALKKEYSPGDHAFDSIRRNEKLSAAEH